MRCWVSIPVMSMNVLKWSRFVAPAVVFFLFYSILGKLTGLWSPIEMPKYEEDFYSITILIIGLLYYILPIREFSNSYYSKKVNNNIVNEFVRISGITCNVDDFGWKKIRSIYYYIIDKNKTLEKKASRAHFNGLFWTILADVCAFSAIFGVICMLLFYLDIDGSLVSYFVFLLTYVLSFPASSLITDRHIEIANEQLEVIENFEQEKVRMKMEEVLARKTS